MKSQGLAKILYGAVVLAGHMKDAFPAILTRFRLRFLDARLGSKLLYPKAGIRCG